MTAPTESGKHPASYHPLAERGMRELMSLADQADRALPETATAQSIRATPPAGRSLLGVSAAGAIALVTLWVLQPSFHAGALEVAEVAQLAVSEPAALSLGPGGSNSAVLSRPVVPYWRGHGSRTVEGTDLGGATEVTGRWSIFVTPHDERAEAVQDGDYFETGSPLEVAAPTILDYRPDGLFIVGRQALDQCQMDVPVLRWPSPVELGRSWSTAGICRYHRQAGGLPHGSLQIAIDGKVTKAGVVTVSGKTFAGFIVDSRITTIEERGQGEGRTRQTEVEREFVVLVPDLGWFVELSKRTAIEVVNAGRTERRRESSRLTLAPGI